MKDPDDQFAVPRLAEIYDVFDGDRNNLDLYRTIVDELKASTVLDLGCGTGTFACSLALRDKEVVGVDPAAASVDVARCKPGGDRVKWIVGDATALPLLQVDVCHDDGERRAGVRDGAGLDRDPSGRPQGPAARRTTPL